MVSGLPSGALLGGLRSCMPGMFGLIVDRGTRTPSATATRSRSLSSYDNKSGLIEAASGDL